MAKSSKPRKPAVRHPSGDFQVVVEVRDLEELSRDIYRLTEEMQGKVWLESAHAGEKVAEEWLEREVHGPKSGKKWPNLPNVSSAPYEEVWAYQSGTLWRSMQVKEERKERTRARVRLSFGAYAEALEFGHSKAAQRKFLRAAVDENEQDIVKAMAEKPNEVIDRFMRKR